MVRLARVFGHQTDPSAIGEGERVHRGRGSSIADHRVAILPGPLFLQAGGPVQHDRKGRGCARADRRHKKKPFAVGAHVADDGAGWGLKERRRRSGRRTVGRHSHRRPSFFHSVRDRRARGRPHASAARVPPPRETNTLPPVLAEPPLKSVANARTYTSLSPDSFET